MKEKQKRILIITGVILMILITIGIVYLQLNKEKNNIETEGDTCIRDGETFSFMEDKICCDGLIEQLLNRSITVCTSTPCAGEGEQVNRNPLSGSSYDTPCCPSLEENRVSKSYSICE